MVFKEKMVRKRKSPAPNKDRDSLKHGSLTELACHNEHQINVSYPAKCYYTQLRNLSHGQ